MPISRYKFAPKRHEIFQEPWLIWQLCYKIDLEITMIAPFNHANGRSEEGGWRKKRWPGLSKQASISYINDAALKVILRDAWGVGTI